MLHGKAVVTVHRQQTVAHGATPTHTQQEKIILYKHTQINESNKSN